MFILVGCSDAADAPAATAAATTVAAGAPTLILAPASGYAGAQVSVSGQGWPAATMVLVKLADVQGHSPILAAATTDASGQFATDFDYPGGERWLQPGVQAVIAHTQDNRVEVAASFLVVAPVGAATSAVTATLTPTLTLTMAAAAPTVAPTARPTITPAPAASASPTPAPPVSATLALNAGALAAALPATPAADAAHPAPALPIDANAPARVSLDNGYRVSFLGVDQHADGASTWRYLVEKQPGAKKLQVWGLELPPCTQVVDASPAGWEVVAPGQAAALGGISWKTRGNFEHGEFAVTVSGRVTAGIVHVAAKAPKIAQGTIAGPSCQ